MCPTGQVLPAVCIKFEPIFPHTYIWRTVPFRKNQYKLVDLINKCYYPFLFTADCLQSYWVHWWYLIVLGRFQNYSIPILLLGLFSISIMVDFGKYSWTDFFTISILKSWVKIVDFSILIKINPAKKLVFLGFLSLKIESYL